MFLRRILEINCSRLPHQEDVLTFDMEGGDLLVYRRLPPNLLPGNPFDDFFNAFIATLAYWDKTAFEERMAVDDVI